MANQKVVVIGSSYSALAVFYYLEKSLTKTREPIELLLISNKNHYFFKSLLYQCLCNDATLNDISQQFRNIGFLRPDVSYLETEVLSIDYNNKVVKSGHSHSYG